MFDGVIAQVAGAGRGSFNHRFAQPSRDGHPYINFFYPTDIFPFTDVAQKDPETGVTDGLLTHAGLARAAAEDLLHELRIRVLGPRRVADPHDRRRHGRRAADGQRAHLPARRRAARPGRVSADADDRPAAQQPARLPVGDEGAAAGDGSLDRERHGAAAEPLSAHRRRHAGAGRSAAVPEGARRRRRRPRFIAPIARTTDRSSSREGIVTIEPPRIGTAFPILVPQVDADGNGLAGVRMPELAVPLATYTGWNLFNDRSGPTDVLSSMQGSYIPLPRTAADRKRANDPRPVDRRALSRQGSVHRPGVEGRAGADRPGVICWPRIWRAVLKNAAATGTISRRRRASDARSQR